MAYYQKPSLQQRRRVFAWAFLQLEHENRETPNSVTDPQGIIKIYACLSIHRQLRRANIKSLGQPH